MMNYSSFELIYRNAIPPVHTYQFINVLSHIGNPRFPRHNVVDDNSAEGSANNAIVFTINQEKFVLEISMESAKVYPSSTKEKCVDRAINESRLFMKNAWYLYNNNGQYGRFHIERQTFEPFDDADAAQKVHEFFYNTLSLTTAYSIY
jgi:hypothetical protein